MVGDIILMMEDKTYTTKWPIGRVITVHPGRDGYVRVVTVKTNAGTYKRPVALLLETGNCEDQL